MSLYKSLFKQTAIYGLATVLPRIISFILNPVYVEYLPDREANGDVALVFAYLVFFNVVLAYGMETAFFRFYSKEDNKKSVISTSMVSLFWSSIAFLFVGLLFRKTVANWTNIDIENITYAIWILVLDALVIIPFSKLRAERRPIKYAVIKILNVTITLLLTIFFLVFLPKWVQNENYSALKMFYYEDFEVGYVFVSHVVASLITFIILSPDYFKISWKFDSVLWKKMFRYAFPVLIAGIAFAVNEHLDKILLEKLGISKSDIGAYSACYKIGMFMVLYRTAYTLGIEPFFFSHAKNENAPQTYATITKYFVIFGSFICLFVVVFIDLLKYLLVPKSEFWYALNVVPLIVLANFFLGIYTNLSVWYKLIDKTKIGAYISIVGALITLALNFILIPKYSYVGSAVATIAAYGMMMIISYQMGQKKYPIPYEINVILKYLGISILFSAVSFYVPFFRENYFAKIVLLFLFLYFIYHNEKAMLLRILKTKK